MTEPRFLLLATGAIIALEGEDESGDAVLLHIAPDRLELLAPWGRIVFDAHGVHITEAT